MGYSINSLQMEFQTGKFKSLLKDIYVDDSVLEYQENRYLAALENFRELYGEREVEIYSAPGRSEVGGNHTDHQRGRVLATALNLDAIAIVSPTFDQQIQIKSKGYPMVAVDLKNLAIVEKEKGSTKALIKGVAAKLQEAGYEIGGFCAYVTSDVLSGAGMSSSAAFEVLIGNIFSGLFNQMKIDPVFLAQAGQYAENEYFGKPCGLMDQMASSIGGLIYIDFKNLLAPMVKKIPFEMERFEHSLCIVDTKGSHANLTDEYAAIPEEMKKVASFLGEEVLRNIKWEEFYRRLPELREYFGDRAVLRSLHFFKEDERVEKQVNALQNGDFEEFKKLVKQSGASSFQYLQNVYANKDCEHQNIAVGLAISEMVLNDRGVCRVHGGGFAGTIQAFVPDELVKEYQSACEHVFGKGTCHILKVRKYGGRKVL